MIPGILRHCAGPAIGAILLVAGANAQGLPPAGPGGANPVCSRLEAQLAALERGTSDNPAAEQARRYEEAASRQQFELDRTVAQSRRMGCETSGFFLFGMGQPPQCEQLTGQIQRMRANLDRIMSDVQQLRSGPGNVEGQRRAILTSLGQYDCGPQYRVAAPAQPPQQSFLGSLFGGGGGGNTAQPGADPNSPAQGSNFRTICVRTCDGFFFPISYAASPAKFGDDERVCQRMCPAAEVALYSYRNPGEDVSQAVSTGGRPYSELANAFRYRQEYNPTCSCRREGESWADALKQLDDRTIERGDVVVTEEKAKALSQPKPPAPASGNRKAGSKGQTAAPAPSTEIAPPAAPTVASEPPPPPATAATELPPAAPSGKRSVRAVGPQFIPPR